MVAKPERASAPGHPGHGDHHPCSHPGLDTIPAQLPPPLTLPVSPVQASPVPQPSLPASPVSSPEQLGWGSIEDEDGAYAPRVTLSEPVELGQPRSSER
jgi:hypothetical protein